MPSSVWKFVQAKICGLLVASFIGTFANAAVHDRGAWLSVASDADFYAVWPKDARKAGISGRVVVQCGVEDSGSLSGCRIVRETPSGMGFGDAMLTLIPKFSRRPPEAKDPRVIRIPADWYEFDKAADWKRKPSAEQLVAVFPRAAAKSGQGGRAIINCIVAVQGTLSDCVPLSESPEGVGFAQAAIALTPQFLMKPATSKGMAVVSTVSIPITWPSMAGGFSGPGKSIAPAVLPWAEAPSYEDVVAAYPPKAREQRLAGTSALNCDMTEEGRLNSCDLIRSEPGGYGFDLAAKQLVRKFRLDVVTPADKAATRRVAVHIPFTFDPEMLTDAPRVIGKPTWASIPNSEQLNSAFGRLQIVGTARARLSCTVQAGGTVGACRVESEEPVGSGVGAAAMGLTNAFRLSTWTAEGLPIVGGVVRIPIRYEGDAKPAAATPPK